MFTTVRQIKQNNDAALVLMSLGGDREAFCEIVTRYQNLLCSLAYSSVGDVRYSEDIAQEAFVEAWKKLDTLKDPEKLKSWLCGILRFKVSHYLRKETKQPANSAEELSEQNAGESENSAMEEAAINAQEHTLMWQTLDKMEPNYREPLILFYREEQSIEQVAKELDLTEDNVKQRLSRGRKLLHKSMIGIVEDALVKSKPGTAFTAAVLASISTISPPTKAAAFGAGAAKTGSFFSFATLITLVAVCSGFISSFFGLRASLDQSRTQRERRQSIKTVLIFIGVALLYVLGVFVLRSLAVAGTDYPMAYAISAHVVVFGFVAIYLVLVKHLFAQFRAIRAQERIFNPEAFRHKDDQIDSKKREYKSRISIFGVPLFHFRLGMPETGDKPVFGWIAGGEYAYGLLFAWGGVSIAPVSVGIVSVGIISVGAIGFGLLSLGTVAIGVIAFGSSAIGYQAYASMSSLGWESAFSNGFSIAKDAAIGPIAFANEVNNELAAEIVKLDLFSQTYLWGLAFIAIVVIVPAAWHSMTVRKHIRQR